MTTKTKTAPATRGQTTNITEQVARIIAEGERADPDEANRLVEAATERLESLKTAIAERARLEVAGDLAGAAEAATEADEREAGWLQSKMYPLRVAVEKAKARAERENAPALLKETLAGFPSTSAKRRSPNGGLPGRRSRSRWGSSNDAGGSARTADSTSNRSVAWGGFSTAGRASRRSDTRTSISTAARSAWAFCSVHRRKTIAAFVRWSLSRWTSSNGFGIASRASGARGFPAGHRRFTRRTSATRSSARRSRPRWRAASPSDQR